MKKDFKSMDIKDLTRDAKVLGKPAAILAVLVLVFIFALSFGIKNIKKLLENQKTLRNTQSILVKKLAVLNDIKDNKAGQIAGIEVALPEKNSAIYAISQVKSFASEKGLAIANLRSGGNFDDKGITRSALNFEISGDLNMIYGFLADVSSSLPMMNIEKVKISNEAGIYLANINLNVYSAELPKKIPSITSPVTGLNSDELDLLNQLAGYKQPFFLRLEPQINNERQDIFN